MQFREKTQSGLITDLSNTRFCTTTLNLPDDGLGSRYSYRTKRFIGITDDRLVFYANSSCIKSNGKQNEIVDELLVYDTNGNQTSHIYLKDIFRNICESSRVRIESVTKENRLYRVIKTIIPSFLETAFLLGSSRSMNSGSTPTQCGVIT